MNYHVSKLLIRVQEENCSSSFRRRTYAQKHPRRIWGIQSQYFYLGETTRNECQTNVKAQEDYDYMKENLCLCKELEESKKENLFLKNGGILFKIKYRNPIEGCGM